MASLSLVHAFRLKSSRRMNDRETLFPNTRVTTTNFNPSSMFIFNLSISELDCGWLPSEPGLRCETNCTEVTIYSYPMNQHAQQEAKEKLLLIRKR
jgi:hypothetical protein